MSGGGEQENSSSEWKSSFIPERSPQGPRSPEPPPTRSVALPRLSRVCSAALWIFAPQTSRPFSYNPSRVSRCEREHAAEPEVPPWDFFFPSPSPFCDSQMWVARGGEPASGSRPRRGRSCCWWEGGRAERLARSEMLHCYLLPFPPRRRRDFNHLRARRKWMGGTRLASTYSLDNEPWLFTSPFHKINPVNIQKLAPTLKIAILWLKLAMWRQNVLEFNIYRHPMDKALQYRTATF